MKIEDILKKQREKGLEPTRLKASTLSIEEYTRDKNSPRPYHIEKVNKVTTVSEKKKKNSSRNIEKPKRSKKLSLDQKIIHPINNENFRVGRKLKPVFNYIDLVGNSKLIVDEILRRCLITNSDSTGFIEKREFSEIVGVTMGSIKTTCVRLKEKKVFDDFRATKGRHSKWKFTLSSRIIEQARKIRES
ncbi:Uncharacterised protein [Legionella beliardensis]|uniref:Uncharacterized protein n=2 Tax=Legionella beliardensis TaxID=91822 RepID=A0A378JP73_9GAMM|nr:Uncharacterised protein [Legionella beliardensis]